jgi:hypothetical protein
LSDARKYWRFLCQLVALFTLNLADAATTLHLLSFGATELNPLFGLQTLEGKIAAPAFFAVSWILTYAYCDRHGHEKLKAALKALLAVLLGLYALIVCNNLLQLARALG